MARRSRGIANRWCLLTSRIVLLTVAAVLVSSCVGDGGTERPTGGASRPATTSGTATTSPTQTASPAETETSPAPTRTQTRTGPETRTSAATTPVSTRTPTQPVIVSPRPTPTDTAVPTETVTATVTATSTVRPTPETSSSPVPETPTTAPTTAPTTPPTSGTSADTDGAPAWLWWLLGALVLATVAAVPLIVRGRRRRAWNAEFAAAVDEVAWFARVLVPELRQAGSVEQVRGGWAVGEDRAAAVEDRLTALEATAHDDADRARVRGLRDVVRASRQRIVGVTALGTADPSLELERVAADLEAALAAWSPATTPPPPGQAG